MTVMPTPEAAVGAGRDRLATLPPLPPEYARLERLYAIQAVLAQPLAIEQACDAVVEIVARTLPIRTAVVVHASEELQRVLVWGAANVAPAALEAAREHAGTAFSYLARKGSAADSVKAVARTMVFTAGATHQTDATGRYVTLPLSLAHGRVFGVFQIEGADTFGVSDLLLTSAVANQIAVALDRQRVQLQLETARAAAERANRRLQDLHAISKAALEKTTLDESLSSVLGAVRSLFAADVAAVLLVDARDGKLRRRARLGLEDAGAMESAVDSGTPRSSSAAGTAMVFEDIEEREDLGDLQDEGPCLRANGVRSVLGAPMRVRDHLTGFVYLASRVLRPFTDDELELLVLVADRIASIIDNAALYERALEAVRSREVVMGVVSHDLRNPLNAIVLCGDLLTVDEPQGRAKALATIKRASAVMLRLIDDLRDIGSIEAGHLSVDVRPEDACALVREAIEGVQHAASKKALCIEAHVPSRAVVVDCDRVRLIQVLTNLLSNAVKFTPGRGSIVLSLEAVGTQSLCFSIADTGRGIPEADLPRVFDRYWQAPDTAHLGTGLGLAITKALVEAHGGTISVTSCVGRGTTFSFVLPRARSSAGLDDEHRGRKAAPKRARSRHPGARVLAVDDEPHALAALTLLLEDEGFSVEKASSGVEALAKVREFAPDILLIDVEMPGLAGPEVVGKLRAERPEFPVIVMTGHSGQLVTSGEIGPVGYIRKPLELDELVAAIDRELEQRSPTRGEHALL